MGHDFNIHAPFGRGNQNRPTRFPINHNTQVEFASNLQPLFDQQGVDDFSFRAGLNRHQRASQHASGIVLGCFG